MKLRELFIWEYNYIYIIYDTYYSMYNNVVMRCFDTCIYNFRSKTLDKSEISCVEQCAERYIKLTQRVGLRFAEHQAIQQQRMEQQTTTGTKK